MLGKLVNCSYQNRNAALGLKVHVVFEGEPHKGAAKLKRWYRVFFRGMQRYVYRTSSPQGSFVAFNSTCETHN